jgi:hypothetical protein
MNAKDAIRTALASTQHVLTWYVSDLSDADLFIRPAPGANHIAWQIGHLIIAEQGLAGQNVPGAKYPELPPGFLDNHNRNAASKDGPDGFLTKDKYVALFNQFREATMANAANLSEADLDKPTKGDVAKFAPTVGALLLLVSNHTLMHAGQFTVVRRKLGKPVLF